MPTGYRLLAVRLRTAHLLGDPDVLAALLHPQAHWHRPDAAAGTTGDRDAAAEFLLAEPKDGAGPLAVEETIAFPRAAVLALRPSPPPPRRCTGSSTTTSNRSPTSTTTTGATRRWSRPICPRRSAEAGAAATLRPPGGRRGRRGVPGRPRRQ